MTWETVLADLEQRVELAEIALDDGVDLDPQLLIPWVPPEGLGPLHESLRDRAVAVLAKQTELEQRLQFSMDQISRELSKSNGNRKLSPFAESVVPKYFDRAV